MVHEKEDFIKMEGRYYRCICADKEIAVFASVSPHKKDDGYRTHLTDLFCCGQETATSIQDYWRFYRGEFTSTFPLAKNMKRKSRGVTSGVEVIEKFLQKSR